MADLKRCSARAYGDSWGGHRCTRTGTIHEDGKLWCKQHSPSFVKARWEAKTRQWAEKRAAKDREYRHQKKLADLERAIVDAVAKASRGEIPGSVAALVDEYHRLTGAANA